MEDVMRTECNESQMRALVSGLDQSPVVLIQARPPCGPLVGAETRMPLISPPLSGMHVSAPTLISPSQPVPAMIMMLRA